MEFMAILTYIRNTRATTVWSTSWGLLRGSVAKRRHAGALLPDDADAQ